MLALSELFIKGRHRCYTHKQVNDAQKGSDIIAALFPVHKEPKKVLQNEECGRRNFEVSEHFDESVDVSIVRY